MTVYAKGSFWYYEPNKGAPIAFSALFLISSIIHTWQCIHYRSWRLTLFLPWGTLLLAAGYAMRAVGAWHYDNLKIYIASTVLIIMGPPVYAACLYITLGRAMYYIPWLSIIHPGRVMTTFIGLDALCEIVLGSGAPRATNTEINPTERQVGIYLIRAGLIMQVVLFVVFLALAAHFHVKCAQRGVSARIRVVLIVLYVTGFLILERNILRVAEQYGGFEGNIYRSEPIFWTLESCPMLLVTYILHIWHPARLLPTDYKVYLAMDGVTERQGPGWVDKRPFLVTLFDPFNLAGLCSRSKKNKSSKFWENDSEQHEVVNTQDVGPSKVRGSSV